MNKTHQIPISLTRHSVALSVSQFSNAHYKKFEFDFAGSRQHNPLTLRELFPSFRGRKEASPSARRRASLITTL